MSEIAKFPALTIDADEAGQRLDRFLRKRLAAMPLSRIHKLLRTGKIRVDGRKGKPDEKLTAGCVVTIQMEAARFAADAASRRKARAPRVSQFSPADVEILYRDEHVLIVNKPAGLLVHPGAGHENEATLIDLVHARPEFAPRDASTFAPALVHRLDKDTSGAVVIALSGVALRALTALFRKRGGGGTLEKIYLALVHGKPHPARGEIVAAIERRDAPHAGAQKSFARAAHESRGKPAVTGYRVVAQRVGTALLELELKTGRTHQIRAHLLSRGWPIVGDERYGAGGEGLSRQFLHAFRLRFTHPVTGKLLDVAAPLPPELVALLAQLGYEAVEP